MISRCALALALLPVIAWAQADAGKLAAVLKEPILPTAVTEHEIRQFLWRRIAELTVPRNAKEWQAEAGRRREQLTKLIFHGWPKEWIDAKPIFEDAGLVPVEASAGYRIRKLRYEVVPGFYSTALLYEPSHINRKVWKRHK